MPDRQFEYTPEYYGGFIDEAWMTMGGDRSTPEGLKKWYDCDYNRRYRERFKTWFKDVELKGRGLELGFQCGKSAYWLYQRYPDITLDILDWNEKLRCLESQIRALSPRIDRIMFNDCQNIPLESDLYDFITCLDFYEHLTEEIYFNSIVECHRLLKNGCPFLVFIGKGVQDVHINLRSVPQLVSDITCRGFELERQVKSGNNIMNIFRARK